MPQDVAGMVARISDRDALKGMLKQAIICNDIDALREAFSMQVK